MEDPEKKPTYRPLDRSIFMPPGHDKQDDSAAPYNGPSLGTILLVFLFFPPVGFVMMLIGCSVRQLDQADYFLGFLIPLFGLIRFWNC